MALNLLFYFHESCSLYMGSGINAQLRRKSIKSGMRSCQNGLPAPTELFGGSQ
jgi:hypothetical protein